MGEEILAKTERMPKRVVFEITFNCLTGKSLRLVLCYVLPAGVINNHTFHGNSST